MLRNHARGFLSKNAPIAHLRQLRDSKDATGFSRPLWKDSVHPRMGRHPDSARPRRARPWPCRSRRGDGGARAHSHPIAVSFDRGARRESALARAGNDKQKSAYLPKIASGDLIATLAVDESSKHRPEKTSLAATRSGNGFSLKGRRPSSSMGTSPISFRSRANLGRARRYQGS